jgi:hypothetical protein
LLPYPNAIHIIGGGGINGQMQVKRQIQNRDSTTVYQLIKPAAMQNTHGNILMELLKEKH